MKKTTKKTTKKETFTQEAAEKLYENILEMEDTMQKLGADMDKVRSGRLFYMTNHFDITEAEAKEFLDKMEKKETKAEEKKEEKSFYIKSEGMLHRPELKYFHNTKIEKTIYERGGKANLHCELKTWWGGNVLVELFFDEGLGGALIDGKEYYATYYQGKPILRKGVLTMSQEKAGERSHDAILKIITMFERNMMEA